MVVVVVCLCVCVCVCLLVCAASHSHARNPVHRGREARATLTRATANPCCRYCCGARSLQLAVTASVMASLPA